MSHTFNQYSKLTQTKIEIMQCQKEQKWTPCCTRLISKTLVTALLLSTPRSTQGFVHSTNTRSLHPQLNTNLIPNYLDGVTTRPRAQNTQLNVWWFGGTDNSARTEDDELCELVAVRIEKPTANSRRIAGNISVPRPIDDVWAILTDYDNLSIHVPNLVESRQVNPSMKLESQPGDGSYNCRLYQKGAQKIVGFEFGASVTMDMKENVQQRDSPSESRQIGFKCVESQFFSEFDGYWKVSPTVDPENPSQPATNIEYVVLVKPRGPVPVAALEWRIREDVPTNLRAVKLASIELGLEGVLDLRKTLRNGRNGQPPRPAGVRNRIGRFSSAASTARRNVGETLEAAVVSATAVDRRMTRKLAPVRVDWYEDETMATYLNNKRS